MRQEQVSSSNSVGTSFFRQASNTPGAVAVRHGQKVVSYGELLSQALVWGGRLSQRGVRPGDRVAVYLPKSIDAVAGILGCMASGSSYVPLDVRSPIQATMDILMEFDFRQVVTTRSLKNRLLNAGLPSHMITDAFGGEPPISWLEDVKPAEQQEAYVLFTTGTTGKPKGAVHTQSSCSAFLDWASTLLQPVPTDVFASVAPFHFDLSILDLFAPLKHGSSSWLVDRALLLDPRELMRELRQVRPTIWYSTPSVLRLLLRHVPANEMEYSGFRFVMFAGEHASRRDLKQLMELWPGARFMNIYGCTETNNTFQHEVCRSPHDGEIPIGRPIAGVDVKVVQDGHEVPHGKEGELRVSANTMMLGYWNAPALNKQVMVQGTDGRIWYRTGDIAACDSDGVYWLRGRTDRMLKRGGHRVHPAEIEGVIEAFAGVGEAAVVPDRDGNLSAFVRMIGPATSEGLLSRIAERLPAVKCPNRVVSVDSMPLTETGKVDYQKLVANHRNLKNGTQSFKGNTGQSDSRMFAENWVKRENAIKTIQPADTLSALGLDSIRMLDLLAALHEQFRIQISAVAFTLRTTWSEFQTILETADCSDPAEKPPVGNIGPSFMMERLFRLAPDGIDPSTNIVEQYQISGEVSRSAVATALGELQSRHPALRAYARRKQGKWRIVVSDTLPVALEEIQVPDVPQADREARVEEIRRQSAAHCFKWDAEPRLRVTWVQFTKHDSYLILVAHHAWTDLGSFNVFFEEICDLLEENMGGVRAHLLPGRCFQLDQARLRAGEASDEGWEREQNLAAICALVRPQVSEKNNDPEYGRCVIVEQALDSDLMGRLNDCSRVTGTSQHAICILASLLTQRRFSGRKNVALTSILDRRVVFPWAPSVGHYLSYPIFILRDEVVHQGVSSMIQEMSLQFQDARSALLCEAVGRSLEAPEDQLFQTWGLNFLGRNTEETRTLGTGATIRRIQPNPTNHSLGWHMNVQVGESPQVRLICMGDHFERGVAQETVEYFLSELRALTVREE